MKFTSFIFSLFLLALLLAPLSVQAQRDRIVPVALCYDKASGQAFVGEIATDGTPDCSSQGTAGQRIGTVIATQFYAICYSSNSGVVIPGTDGKYTCPTSSPKLVPCTSWPGINGMCLTKPVVIPPPGNTNVPPTSNIPGGGTTTGSNEPCDPPEPGFHKVGGLCIPNSPFDDKSIAGSGSIDNLAVRIINIMLYLAGIVAVIMIIIGGYQYMTAAGNDTQAANGRKTLVNAIIGLAIIILSYVIVQAVVGFVT